MTAKVPIFVIGCQRSGTSLLGELLGRKPGIVTLPEAQFLLELVARPTEAMSEATAVATVDWLLHQFRYWTLGLECPGSRLVEVAKGKAPLDLWDWIVTAYAARVGVCKFRYWVEHSPENTFHLIKLFEAFPTARAVHIVRDGRGVFASFRDLQWGRRSAKRVAEAWVTATMSAFALERLFPDRVVRVRYEDLLERPELELSRIMHSLSIEGADAALGGSTLRLPSFTREQHALVGSALNSKRAAAWRAKLTKDEIVRFEQVTASILAYFSYEPTGFVMAQDKGHVREVVDMVYDSLRVATGRVKMAITERRLVNAKLKTVGGARPAR